ncbi:MAG TPA: toast rack family protein [Anaerolineae bacterium]|nr:toast rack family protein [Anaerolineae bacterium]
MNKHWGYVLIAGMLWLVLGCSFSGINVDTVEVGELVRETREVELEDAAESRVDIKMGAGELRIAGGAESLLQADFAYNVANWKPQVDYSVTEEQGRLTIKQPKTENLNLSGNIRYEWDLRFNEAVPLDLRIECGVGDTELKLGALNVTHADVQVGVGDLELDLSENTSLTELELDLGTGAVTVDLTGDWEHDVNVSIQGGVGQMRLVLPEAIGVRVKVDKGIGDVDASGLYRDGSTYVNKAYEDTQTRIEVNIQAGVGQIDLEVVD